MTFIVICLTDTNVRNQNEIPMKKPENSGTNIHLYTRY